MKCKILYIYRCCNRRKLAITLLDKTAKYVLACGKSSILECKPPKCFRPSELRLVPQLESDVVQIAQKSENPVQNIIKLLRTNKSIRKLNTEGIKQFCKSIDTQTTQEIEKLLTEGKEPLDVIGYFSETLSPNCLLGFGNLCKLDLKVILDRLSQEYSKGRFKTLDETINATKGMKNGAVKEIMNPEKLGFLRYANISLKSPNQVLYKIGTSDYLIRKETLEIIKMNRNIPPQEYNKYCRQLIECDYMFIQSLGLKLLGTERIKGLNHNEIFALLKKLDTTEIAKTIGVDKSYVEPYFSRRNIYELLQDKYEVSSVNGRISKIGGDAIVHNLTNSFNKNMSEKEFATWVDFCKQDEIANKYIKMFDACYQSALKRVASKRGLPVDKLDKEAKEKVQNFYHLILRAAQRNVISDRAISSQKQICTKDRYKEWIISDAFSVILDAGKLHTPLHTDVDWLHNGIYIPNF